LVNAVLQIAVSYTNLPTGHAQEIGRRMGVSLSALPLRDPVSSITHLVTSLFAAYVTLLLWRLARGDRTKRLSLAVFGVTAVVLYAASGTYHAILLPADSPTVDVFRRLDHSAIYLLIAGTYTPAFAVLLRGRQRLWLLTTVWLLAVAGIAAKWLWPMPPEALTVGLYLALGWIGVVPMRALLRAVGWEGMAWGLGGGLCYTAGAACELARWPVLVPGVIGWHEIFHVFDMAGTTMHVVFMIRCVIPFRHPERVMARVGGDEAVALSESDRTPYDPMSGLASLLSDRWRC
jgi:hemolysin III